MMKYIQSTIIMLLISFPLFADAGLAFRYKVDIHSLHGTSIKGYLYHYTYSNGYEENKENFCDYYQRERQNICENFLYKEIKSIKISDYIEIDFSLTENKLLIDMDAIDTIDLLETKEFMIYERIQLIEDKSIYNLMENKSFKTEEVYIPELENCQYQILDFSNTKRLNETKSILLDSLKANLNKEGEFIHSDFYIFYQNEKKKLIQQKILLFEYCEAL